MLVGFSMKLRTSILAGASTLAVIAVAAIGLFAAQRSPDNGGNPSREQETADSGLPSVKTVSIDCDFGTVAPGAALEKTVAIRNDGATAISLMDVATSCGCTLADVSKETIEPGQSADVKVSYSPPSIATTEERQVLLRFEGNEPRVFAIVVRAHVRPEMSILPLRLRVSSAKEGVAVVYNYGKSDWLGIDVRSRSGSVAIASVNPLSKVEVPDGARQAYKIRVVPGDIDSLISTAQYDRLDVVPLGGSGIGAQEIAVEIAPHSESRILPSLVTLSKGGGLKKTVLVMLPSAVDAHASGLTVRVRRTQDVLPTEWESLASGRWKATVDFSAFPFHEDVQGEAIELTLRGNAVAEFYCQLAPKGAQ